MGHYRGFAQVEYEYVRGRVYEPFEWTTFEEPSPSRLLERPLSRSRVALVATAGAHLPDQPAFDLGKSGDSSYRELPADAQELRFSHVGYDTRRAREDADVVFPLSLLRRLASEGEIGELAPRAFSFMGYIPETGPLLQQTGPQVAVKLLADAVDLVLLVPSWPVCQQSVGLLQRVFDEHGLATVSLTQVREISELVKPSLACVVEHPFGLTLGAVGDEATHRAVLRACLAEATQPHPAGTIVDLGFRWEHGDLRERQLRKQAH